MRRVFLALFIATFSAITFAQKFDYVYKGIEFRCKIESGAATITRFDAKAHNVTIPATVQYKGSNYAVKKVSTFLNGVNYLTINLVLEEGIEEIDKFAFNEFRKLQTVSIPSTVRHIGKNAFRDNNMLKFNMLSSIDEASLRNGVELWPSAEGTMIATSTPQQERQENLAAKSLKKQKDEKLEKELKEQERLLAEIKRENERLQKEAERLEKEKNDMAENTLQGEENGSSDKSIGGFLRNVFAGKKKTKNIPSAPQETVAQNTEAPAVNPKIPNTEASAANPKIPLSDVDIDIPVTGNSKNQNTYCVIIANEEYEDVSNVDYASRDGEVFKEYCIKTLGIPEKQIRSFINASYTDIKRAINWMETMANISAGNSKMIFYYAGHGIPNEKDKTAYLIPTDGFPKDVSTCFKLSELYGRLGKLNSKNVTVLLDACFSGVQRGSNQALVAARGVAIKPKNEALSGNMVVFSAASDDETALSYESKHHGMFTYFLLDQLKKSKGNATLGEMFTTITQEVQKNSMLENDKLQTPSVNVSPKLKATWKELKF
ncbi:MAG: caspase family protein [Bacteroidaceae bacterium]|nr:caspase family protein [Bacteroidaceae bacterium]